MINDKLILAMNEVQDALGSLNMRAQIDLPQIAVVGSQSSGKSSVLEALVGRDFLPRGSGIVTRCPLVLKLQVGPTSGGEFGEFNHKAGQKFTDFNEIRREIERRTEEIAGPTGITPNPILLTVTSPNVLNLTCVDLPGIVMTATQGQHEGIEKAILEMVINFIRPENTIILAVTPANADMANSVAIRTARVVDPEGQRTIGVLTKIDIMDEGTDALDALENRTIPLKRGWVGVVNRSQKAINENRSMTDARKLEMKFFEEHPIYSKIASKCGTQFLAKTMSEVLMSHIKKSLPELRRKIEDMLADTQKRMEQMGMTDSMNKDNSSTLLALLQQYCSLLRDAIEGRQPPPGAENESLYGGALIDDMLQRRFTEHVTSMKAGPRLTDDLLRETTRNAAGIEGTLITSERGFRILAKKQVRTLEDPMLKCVDVVHDELRRLCMLCGGVLARYPTLQTRVQEIMCNAITEFRGPCAAHVRTMVASEANYINVKHPKIQDLVMRTDLGPQLPTLPTHAPNGQPLTPQQQQQLQLQQLHQLQQQQQQPLTPQQREQAEFAKLRELVETYFTICKSTTCDQLPKIINLLLVMKVMTDSDKLLMHALFRDDLFADLLAESPAVARRREGLLKMFQALNKAKGALDHVRDIPLGSA